MLLEWANESRPWNTTPDPKMRRGPVIAHLVEYTGGEELRPGQAVHWTATHVQVRLDFAGRAVYVWLNREDVALRVKVPPEEGQCIPGAPGDTGHRTD